MARKIAAVVFKGKMGEEPSDAAYWRTRSIVERLETIESIRAEYHEWKYGTAQPRLQRVLRVLKSESG